MAELALHLCAVCVEELPAEDIDRTGEGTESVHGRWDGHDTGCEDNYETCMLEDNAVSMLREDILLVKMIVVCIHPTVRKSS